MRRKIFRRPRAAQDAEEIATYISKDSLKAALRFLDQVEATILYAAEYPEAGALFVSGEPRLKNIRFCRIQDFPNHILFYSTLEDAIDVVRIIHGARDLDAELSQI